MSTTLPKIALGAWSWGREQPEGIRYLETI